MKEIRSIDDAEFRVLEDSRNIEGYALLFNKESRDLGGFIEVIEENALDGVIEKSDVLALYNHDENNVLARNTAGNGTLELKVDEKGLKYKFNAPKTTLGDEVIDSISRGDLRNSSFAFTLPENGAKWEKRGDKYLRTITKFDYLYDISPVYRPAYSDTTVATRNLNELTKIPKIEDKKDDVLLEATINGHNYSIPQERVKDIVDATDNERKLNEYFTELDKSISKLKK